MKSYLSTAFAAACVLLVIALVVMKHGDSAQQEKDAASITGYSNQLDSAQSLIAARDGTILALSNNLSQCQAASLTISNQLADAIVSGMEEITNLSRQVEEMTAENRALNQSVADLTNQMAGLTQKLAVTESSLARTNQSLLQANEEYALLENRFRIDVAERLVIQRKFYNPEALQAQMDKLKSYPGVFDVAADQIYAGLDVEVKSNGVFHVISPE